MNEKYNKNLAAELLLFGKLFTFFVDVFGILLILLTKKLTRNIRDNNYCTVRWFFGFFLVYEKVN